MNGVRKNRIRHRALSAFMVCTTLTLLAATFASMACNRGGKSYSPTLPAAPQAVENQQVLLETKTNGEDADAPPGPTVTAGDVVTWTYRIRNQGSDTLSGIVLNDDMLGDVTCPSDTLLAGEAMTCRASGIAQEGQYANMATVTAGGTSGAAATDSDPSHYFGDKAGGGSGGGGGGGGGTTPPPGSEPNGCGTGFWKANAKNNGASAWPAPYTPSTTLASAGFVNASGIDPSAFSLRAALDFSGGPVLEDWEKNMVKHAVAALLNSAASGVNYPWSSGQVLGAANEALASNNQQTLANQKDEFESMNSLGCPLE